MKQFVNIHGHSCFSLLDGMTRINELVDKTLELGQPASSITDHGNMFAVAEHYQYALKKGQKALVGFEAYSVNDHTLKSNELNSETSNSRNHLVLLAKNYKGYQKLNRICSKGFTDGFYYKPRIDDNILKEFVDKNENDLICSSACIAGKIPQYILKNQEEKAIEQIKFYNELFNGNFYLELQPTQIYEQYIVNKRLIEISKILNIPLISTTDFHYLNKEDKETHDLLLCMQSSDVMSNPEKWAFEGNTYYVMSREEISNAYKQTFKYKKIKKLRKKKKKDMDNISPYIEQYIYDYQGNVFSFPEKIIDNFIEVIEEGEFSYNDLDTDIIENSLDMTLDIAQQCNVEIPLTNHHLPKIPIPTNNEGFNKWEEKRKQNNVAGKPNEEYLRYLCFKGIKERYPNMTEEQKKIYTERINYELKTINEMEFPDYFLIYYDIMKFCSQNDIPTGPGRGCFKRDSKVQTNRGLINIENVLIGDKVISHDEQEHFVIDTMSYNVDEPLVSIETDTNVISGATQDHKIFAIKKEDFEKGIRTPQWIEIKDLKLGDYVCEL